MRPVKDSFPVSCVFDCCCRIAEKAKKRRRMIYIKSLAINRFHHHQHEDRYSYASAHIKNQIQTLHLLLSHKKSLKKIDHHHVNNNRHFTTKITSVHTHNKTTSRTDGYQPHTERESERRLRSRHIFHLTSRGSTRRYTI